jgi:hypothetical protein
MFHIPNHPMQRFALDRWGAFNVIASATKLTVAVDGRGVRFHTRGSQEHFEKLWGCGVVMLSITEKLLQILLQKPVKIADPVQPFGVNDHAEAWINQEWAASGSRFQIATINRDDNFEIAEGLSLQAIKTLGDEIGALIDWQSHSDARSQLHLLWCDLTQRV